jgi:hypothetical protein
MSLFAMRMSVKKTMRASLKRVPQCAAVYTTD